MLWSQVRGIGPRIVLVHGFTQTHSCWGGLDQYLALDHEVIAVDAPGHGHSSSIALDLVEGSAALGEAGGHGTYLGYSMGARLCLHLALARPELVRALILVGVSAGIEDDSARRDRAALDEKRARQLETDGLDAFLEAWLAQSMFANIPENALCMDARHSNTVEGLASSLRLAGTGSQEPLWPHLSNLHMPVLLIAGERDTAFVDQARRIATNIGSGATVSIIKSAGHAAHLEQPDAFLHTLKTWLAAIE